MVFVIYSEFNKTGIAGIRSEMNLVTFMLCGVQFYE